MTTLTTPPDAPSAVPPTPQRTDTRAAFVTKANNFIAWLAGLGTWLIAFVAWLGTFRTEMTTIQGEISAASSNASARAGDADTSAIAAAASAASALTSPGTSATSTTSLSCTPGSKTLTIQTGKALVVGQFVVIANTPTPSNYIAGQITAYNSGTGALTVLGTTTGGSGTYTDWTISLSAGSAVTGLPESSIVTATSFTAVAGKHYVPTNASATAGTLPASPGDGDVVWVTVANDRIDNTLDPGAHTISGPAGSMSGVLTLDMRNVSLQLRFINNTWRIY